MTKSQELKYIQGTTQKYEQIVPKEITFRIGNTIEKLIFYSELLNRKIEISVDDFLNSLKQIGGKEV